MCWVTFAYAIIVAIVGEILRPKARFKSDRPKGLGDFTFPTAEAGRAVAIWGGTCRIPGMNTTAAGNLYWRDQYKNVKTGWFSSAKQHLSWAYFISIQMIVGLGQIAKVWGVQVDQKFLKANPVVETDHYFDLVVTDESFYGDHKVEGGFSGTMRFYKGTQNQPPEPELMSVLAQDEVSAYPFLAYVMFINFYIGNSTNPPTFTPVLSKWPNTLNLPNNTHIINGTAMNPAAWAYYLMTESIISAGIPVGLIDVQAFRDAGAVLFNEKIGMNHYIDTQTTLRDILDVIEEATDGKIFEDPFTGLWTFTLSRKNYDVSKLPILNESNSRCTARSKSDWWDLKNTFNVIYVDKDRNWTRQSVSSKDQAALAAVNQLVIPSDIECEWCDNIELAQFLAERGRVAGATPFTQLEIEANGTAENLRIGDPFVAQYPTTRRIVSMVCRITDIEYAATDEGVTRIKCTEDKYGVTSVAYTGIPDTKYEPPVYTPRPLSLQLLIEFPYGANPDGARESINIATIGSRSTGIETSYDVYATTPVDSSMHFIMNVDGFCHVGTLREALPKSGPYENFNIVVTNVNDVSTLALPTPEQSAAGLSMVTIDGEWFSYTSFTVSGNDVTLMGVLRAQFDTAPIDHASGARVIFLDDGIGTLGPYPNDYATTVRLPTRSFDQAMNIGDTTALSYASKNRARRPYRPNNVRVNGVNLLQAAVIDASGGDLNLAWWETNRVTQDRKPASYIANSVQPEAGTTYRFKAFDSNGSLVFTTPDFSGTSGTYSPTYQGTVTLQAFSVRNGLESLFPITGRVVVGPKVQPLTISGQAPDGAVGTPY